MAPADGWRKYANNAVVVDARTRGCLYLIAAKKEKNFLFKDPS